MKKILYFDLVGGAAGDMLLASLLDVGASLDAVRDALKRVDLDRVELESKTVYPAGLCARQVDVLIDGRLADLETPSPCAQEHHHHRSYQHIKKRLENSQLDAATKSIALDAFARLAQAESKAHGIDVDAVEFHEVGSDDAIADIVGVATAVISLGVDEIVVSPVPLARGLVKGAHGPIPLPAPATLLLLEGIPVVETSLQGEMVTPTGAALLVSLATRFGPIPSMTLQKVGVGAGHTEWPDRPNIVRAILGEGSGSEFWSSDDDMVLETNIDDMTPEQLAFLEAEVRGLGALDVWSMPIHMKKGRIGYKISVLVRRTSIDLVASSFFTHSTTLGLRQFPVRRIRCDRRVETVSTKYGEIRVKLAARGDGTTQSMPEYEDCARLAKASGVSVRLIYEAALAVRTSSP